MLVKVAVSCKGWNSNLSPVEGGWYMESWRGLGRCQILDKNMEEGVVGCQISPQTLEGQSHLGIPWPEDLGGERAWGGKGRTWCLMLLLDLQQGFSVCPDCWKVHTAVTLQLIDSSHRVQESASW